MICLPTLFFSFKHACDVNNDNYTWYVCSFIIQTRNKVKIGMFLSKIWNHPAYRDVISIRGMFYSFDRWELPCHTGTCVPIKAIVWSDKVTTNVYSNNYCAPTLYLKWLTVLASVLLLTLKLLNGPWCLVVSMFM